MINKVILEGRITKDIELRYTNNNKPVASYSVALNRGKDKNGNDLGADYINVVSWDKAAEFVNNWFHKGDGISIVGHLTQRVWEDNGVKKYALDVVTESIAFPEGKKTESVTAELVDKKSSYSLSDGDLPF